MTGSTRRRLVQPEPPIDRIVSPFREFFQSHASGGILLIAAAIIALVWANSPFSDSYEELFYAPLTIGLGETVFTRSLHFWINDALMAIFFLLVGLEIKREVLVGELASTRRALLPVTAAAGGALLPAAIFLVLAGGTPEAMRGWGIPMATDIAFALGVLALLGSRVPLGLRVFLAALAIVDDLLAVLVIAIFYTADLSMGSLLAAGGILALLVLANALGVRRPVVYAALGVALWIAVYASGIHATIAGVLLALTIPAQRRLDTPEFLSSARRLLDDMDERHRAVAGDHGGHQGELTHLEDITEKAQAPMLRIEHALQPWVAFLIVPLFALANAGVRIPGDPAALAAEPVVLGVALGLIVGKPIGIAVASYLVVRAGLANLPDGVTWPHIIGVGILAGIGFTMSLFIAELAFGTSPELDLAKLGILVASIVAAVGGMVVLLRVGRSDRARPDSERPAG